MMSIVFLLHCHRRSSFDKSTNIIRFHLELKEAFALFDRFGGGMISHHDLAYVMKSIGYQTSTKQLEECFETAH